jgi:hypothetical protein
MRTAIFFLAPLRLCGETGEGKKKLFYLVFYTVHILRSCFPYPICIIKIFTYKTH